MIKSVEETERDLAEQDPGQAGYKSCQLSQLSQLTALTIAHNTSVESLVVRAHPGDLMGVRVSFPGVLTIKTIKT